MFLSKSFLRFADCENLVVNDRLQRIRPFLDQVKEICLSKYIPSRNIAVDETLLLYKGRLVHWLLFIDCNHLYDLIVIQAIQSSKESSIWHQDFRIVWFFQWLSIQFWSIHWRRCEYFQLISLLITMRWIWRNGFMGKKLFRCWITVCIRENCHSPIWSTFA